MAVFAYLHFLSIQIISPNTISFTFVCYLCIIKVVRSGVGREISSVSFFFSSSFFQILKGCKTFHKYHFQTKHIITEHSQFF